MHAESKGCTPRPAVAVLALLAVLAGCRMPGAREEYWKKYEALSEDYRPEVARLRVHEFVIRFARLIEEAADRIAAATDDPRVHRNAVAWKANSVAAAEAAGFRTEPLGGILDMWALCLQMRGFFTEGPGSEVFGAQQGIAIEAVETLEREISGIAKTCAKEAEYEAWRESVLVPWVEVHPIDSLQIVRFSIVPRFAEEARTGANMFGALGSIEEIAFDLSGRLRFLASELPRQIAWEFELAKQDLLEEEAVRSALADLTRASESAERAVEAVDRMVVVVEGMPALVTAEREAAMEQVQAERMSVLEWAEAERANMVETIAAERSIALDTLVAQVDRMLDTVHSERAEILEAVTRERNAAIRDLEPTLEEAIDHLVWRVLQILAAAIVLSPILVWIYGRILRPRRVS